MLRRGGRRKSAAEAAAAPNRLKHKKLHLHLTNCIHLKLHHHHHHLPSMPHDLATGSSDFSFIKDLSILRKSRSLKDPSTSPASTWRSSPLLQKLKSVQSRSQIFPGDGLLEVRTAAAADSVLLLGTRDGDGDDAAAAAEYCSSSRDGWVEISPQDGKSIAVMPSYYRAAKKTSHRVRREASPEFGCRRDGAGSMAAMLPNSSKLASKPSHLLNSIKKLELGKQERYTDLISKRASGIYGVLRREAKPQQAREEEESTAGYDGAAAESNIKTCRSRSNGHGGGKKAKIRRIRRLKSLSAPQKTTTIEGRHSHSHGAAHGQWRPVVVREVTGGVVADELDISELPKHGCGMHLNWSRVHLMKAKEDRCYAGRRRRSSEEFEEAAGAAEVSSRDTGGATTRYSERSSFSYDTDYSDSSPLLERCRVMNSSESGSAAVAMGAPSTPAAAAGRGSNVRHTHSSQLSLSEKYSPVNFQQIVGQTLITRALTNALARGRIAPVYIFGGPRGVGKSCCARVLSLALNCISASRDHTLRPCGSCAECLAQKLAGKCSAFKELSATAITASKGKKKLLLEFASTSLLRYRVFMANECQMLSNEEWGALIEVVEAAPKDVVVFVLATSSLEKLPHAMVSGYQKFSFAKIKEADVMKRMKMIAEKEGIEVEAEALKLIAKACNGSLRDAETMFDQLSLLDQKISLSMAQDMMGIIPEGQLIDLLDFALSADTVNTIQSLKALTISGLDPVNLMSQLASLIMSILAGGGYQIPQGSHDRKKFFRKSRLGKKDMELLRQALRTLSDAEKQLRGSSDKTTWLTAALLQFAPDQSFLHPSSSYTTSVTASSVDGLGTGATTTPEMHLIDRRQKPLQRSPLLQRTSLQRSPLALAPMNVSKDVAASNDLELEEVWQRILNAVHSISLRKFLRLHGKLFSLSLRAGFASMVLQFHELENVCKAESSKSRIARAFQAALGYPMVDVKIVQFSSSTDGHMLQGSSVAEDPPCSSAGSLGAACRLSHLKGYIAANCNKVDLEGKLQDVQPQGLHYKRYLRSDEKYMEVGGPSKHTANHSETAEAVASGKSKSTTKVTESNDAELLKKPEIATTAASSSEEGGKLHDGHSHGSAAATAVEKLEEDNAEDTEIGRDGSNNNRGARNVRFEERTDGRVTVNANNEVEEENLRLESTSTRLLCWHTGDEKIQIKQAENNPKRLGLLRRFCSCADSAHSS